jgi:hypothetical protein
MPWPDVWLLETIGLGAMAVIVGLFFRFDGRCSLPERSTNSSGLTTLRWSPGKIIFALGTLLIGFQQLMGTGMAFHMAGLAQELGVPLEKAFSLFLFISILGIGFSFLGSAVCNRCSLVISMVLLATAIFGTVLGALLLGTGYGRTGFVFSSALSWGLNHVLVYVLSPRLLEPSEVPSGNAVIVGFSNICSSLGPLVLSLLERIFGRLGPGIGIVGILAGLTCMGIVITSKKFPHEGSNSFPNGG